MTFRFNAIDPSSGYEQWFDPSTGAYQLRPPADGLESTTITTSQSQSTPSAVDQPISQAQLNSITGTDLPIFTQRQVNRDLSSNPSIVTGSASSQAGVAAPNDDNSNSTNNTSGATAAINAGSNPGSLIKPQPNILDRYASYTYNLGWYLLSPTQFKEITNNTKLDISQWSLLVQSGGAAAQQAGIAQTGSPTEQLNISATPGRNKYFTLDYYIDDFEINTTLGGGGPATLTEISFKVTEPNGLTLLPNLTNAVRDLYQETNAANNLAFYVMVVKFYGWDINGMLITDPTKNTGNPAATPGISNAVVTRYYPFQITEFNFKMANKAIEYQIKGVPQHFQYAASSGTGSIPYNIELTGETVGDVLSGSGVNPVNTKTASEGRESTSRDSDTVATGPVNRAIQSDSAEVAALFNDSTGYAPGYDPNAGWSA